MNYKTHFTSARFLMITMALAAINLLSGCGIYSFTGASISPDVKTISVKYFPNNAPLVQPTLSNTFTEALRDKFTNQTNLKLVKSGGDLNIEGEITGYSTEPVAIQGNQQAALQRLKITISVRFTNKMDEKQNFETSFSRYEDYDASYSLSQVESGLIETITDALAQDVFNKAVVNW
ncbi:MAG TPA: LptE family protein [Bacteroidales bacterium]|nr:LptE family protein [Bacteroidales bacterium]HPT02559.1 LptE family protein [Bacteroidales bacterium]